MSDSSERSERSERAAPNSMIMVRCERHGTPYSVFYAKSPTDGFDREVAIRRATEFATTHGWFCPATVTLTDTLGGAINA